MNHNPFAERGTGLGPVNMYIKYARGKAKQIQACSLGKGEN
jgi:hypothetical protein